jgi:RNA polymerase sigma-70 factor (ECF subfamily)
VIAAACRESQVAARGGGVTGPDTAEVAAERAEREAVRSVLSRLPRKQASVLVLRHSGLSYQEISSAVGMSAGSVGTTLRRAEATMRKELTDHGSRL